MSADVKNLAAIQIEQIDHEKCVAEIAKIVCVIGNSLRAFSKGSNERVPRKIGEGLQSFGHLRTELIELHRVLETTPESEALQNEDIRNRLIELTRSYFLIRPALWATTTLFGEGAPKIIDDDTLYISNAFNFAINPLREPFDGKTGFRVLAHMATNPFGDAGNGVSWLDEPTRKDDFRPGVPARALAAAD